MTIANSRESSKKKVFCLRHHVSDFVGTNQDKEQFMATHSSKAFVCFIILLVLIGCGSSGSEPTNQNLSTNTSQDQGVNAQILISWPELSQSCSIELTQVVSNSVPNYLILAEDSESTATPPILKEASSSVSLQVNRSPGVTEQSVTTTQKIPAEMFNAIMTFYSQSNLTGTIVTQTSSTLQVNNSGQSQATPMPSFRFYYTFDPQGNRFWSQVDNNNWVERYPDGKTTSFIVQSHGALDGIPGTFVRRVNAPSVTESLEVFFPDKGAASKWVRFRLGSASTWSLLAELTYY
jgi:hypothetical protein